MNEREMCGSGCICLRCTVVLCPVEPRWLERNERKVALERNEMCGSGYICLSCKLLHIYVRKKELENANNIASLCF